MSAEVKTADDVLAFWFDGDIDVRARETPADVSPRASSPPLAIDSNPSLPFLVTALPEDAELIGVRGGVERRRGRAFVEIEGPWAQRHDGRESP